MCALLQTYVFKWLLQPLYNLLEIEKCEQRFLAKHINIWTSNIEFWGYLGKTKSLSYNRVDSFAIAKLCNLEHHV